MNVAIEIPDDIGQMLAGHSGDLSRAMLQAVAIEAYRAGAITPAQVQQMLGFGGALGDGTLPAPGRGVPRLHGG